MKFFLTILFITLFSYCSSVQVVDKNADTVPGFTPIKDSELANRYAPLLAIGSEHGDPFAIYYRASKDLEGNTHITYQQVSFVIDSYGRIGQVEYETAEDYDPSKFGVKHKTILRKEQHKEPVVFKVMSWNHLFDYVGDNASNSSDYIRITPVYFTQKLWEEYEMVKEKESFFSRSRAHKPYEIEFVE